MKIINYRSHRTAWLDLTNRSFKLQTHELVNLSTKFIWKFIEHIPAKSRYHGRHSFFVFNSSLLKVEELIFTNFRRCGFMFNTCCGIVILSTRFNINIYWTDEILYSNTQQNWRTAPISIAKESKGTTKNGHTTKKCYWVRTWNRGKTSQIWELTLHQGVNNQW